MRRREFITLVGGAATAWPLAARAQKALMPVVGWLSSRTTVADSYFLPALREGLSAQGFVEGRNVTIEYRYADGQIDRLPALAADLVAHQSAVIVAVGNGIPATRAAQGASAKIPIVGIFGGIDPVKAGLVTSLNRPGGNITGVITLLGQIGSKRLGLLHDLVPRATTIAILVNPAEETAHEQIAELQNASNALGLQSNIVNVINDGELEGAFTSIAQMRPDALLVTASPLLFISRVKQIVTAAEHLALPTSFYRREFVVAGGLMSYGATVEESYRILGNYTARILKGERPEDLPIQRSDKLELVLNLKTAKALGLAIPTSMLLLADEVIE